MGKITILSLTAIVLFITFQAQAVYLDKQPPPREEYVPNQLLVKYKQNMDPGTLHTRVGQRAQQRSTFFGQITLMFTDLLSQHTPEEYLQQLNSADKQIGLVNREIINSKELTYLLTTNGAKTLKEMQTFYNKLPEVDYAQPNYLYYTMPELP